MTENILAKMFEHNNWANQRIIEACSGLTDAQLDAEPHSAVKGSIRQTLTHLVASQHGYLSILTLPVEERVRLVPAFNELAQIARISGEGLLALSRLDHSDQLEGRKRTRDNYWVDPWVVMLQVINHATEHREQVKSMLSALGIEPPSMDGWDYGEVTGALVPDTSK